MRASRVGVWRELLLVVVVAAGCGEPESPLDAALSSTQQAVTGQHGPLTVTAQNTIVNQYASLGANAPMGSTSITVTNIGDFTATSPYTTGLAAGDLIMIYQAQGATINTTDTAVFGTVTALNGAGLYELVHVAGVTGNQIDLETTCSGLRNAYTTAGATQVIRVPQLTTLTLDFVGSITAPAWNGATGGVVAVHVQGNTDFRGGLLFPLDASGRGFRGGKVDATTSGPPGVATYRSTDPTTGGEKGESIAGYGAAYDSLGGRFGRGAPANGGGGGNASLAAGGGGANADNGQAWTGAGVMTGSLAWTLDPAYVANGNSFTTSSGGGRGGYSWSNTDQNASSVGPGNAAWGADSRREVGGLGGHALATDPSNRLFFGGGGGAGDGTSPGAGGAGGGIVVLMTSTISGGGGYVAAAAGSAGGATTTAPLSAPGGGGGGGSVLVTDSGLSGLTAGYAPGGQGGTQNAIPGLDASGGGGGGGGGLVAWPAGGYYEGGQAGQTNQSALSEFRANGATVGATGSRTATPIVPICVSVDLSITKDNGGAQQTAGSAVIYTIIATNNSPDPVTGATITDTIPSALTGVTWSCSSSSPGGSCSPTSGAGNISTTVPLAANGGTATITLRGTIDPALTGSLSNTATVAPPSNAFDPVPGNNSATDTDTIVVSADLAISGTDSPDPVATSSSLVYTLTVTNLGPSTASSITVTDTLPAGASFVSASGTGWTCGLSGADVVCTRATLAPGASPAITVTVTSPATAGKITNQVSVSSTTSDPAMANNTQTITTNGTADVAIAMTDAPDPVYAGQAVTYTIVVTNNGPDEATSLQVSNAVPSGASYNTIATGTGWTCTTPTFFPGVTNVVCSRSRLDAGASTTITLTLLAPAAAGTLTNTAVVTTGSPDPDTSNNSATTTTTVEPSANLRFTSVADSPDPVLAGGTLTYTLNATNSGPSTATNVTVTDTLPSGTTFGSASGTGWSCSHATGVVTCTRATMATGSFPISLQVTAPTTTGTITNSASISSSTYDAFPSNNTTNTTTTVNPSANLALTMNDAPDPVSSGGTVTYTIDITNNGPSSASSLSLTDTLPSGTTFGSASGTGWTCIFSTPTVTCTRSSLAASTTTTVTIAVTAPANATTLTNTATVSSSADPVAANNSATVTTSVDASVDLAISMTDAPDPVLSSQNLTYTLSVTNNGPSTAGTVTVTDTLPAGTTYGSATGTGWSCSHVTGTVTCTRASLAPGAAPSISLVVTPPTVGGTITNSASVSSPASDPVSTNNSISVMTTVTESADLSITLTDSPDPVLTGATITYSIGVSNAGASIASTIAVTHTLPTGAAYASASGTGWTCNGSGTTASCTRASLATGAAPTITVTANAPATAGSASSTASVGATTTDANSANNTATTTTQVNASADLSVAIADSPDPVTAGAPLTYTVDVANAGGSTVNALTATITLGTGVVYGSASGTNWSCNRSGQVVTCTHGTLGVAAAQPITVVTAAPAAGGSVTTTATVSSAVTDPASGNNSASADTAIVASADLGIAIADSPDPVNAGSALGYTITVSNAGPSSASSLTMTAMVDAAVSITGVTSGTWTCTTAAQVVTCTRATQASGSSTISITTTAPVTSGTVTTTATIDSATNDPTSGNDTATATTAVTPVADLSISIADAPDPVGAAGTLTYTLTATNAGPSAATTVTVTDTLPAGTAFVSATGTGWSCNAAGQVVTCSAATLAAAATSTISLVATAQNEGGTITNSASIAAAETDPATGNNTASVSTTVTPSADLAITITDTPDPVVALGTLQFTLAASNAGPSTATSVAVTHTISAGTSITSASGSGWSCSVTGQTIACSRASLAPGAAPAITIGATAPSAVGTVSTTATVESAVADPQSANSTATSTTTVSGLADVSIALGESADPVTAAGALTYSIDVTGNGPTTAENVTVTAMIGTAVVSASGTGWSCTIAGMTVTCTQASLDGAAAPISVSATAPAQPQTITTTATVTSTSIDPEVANNSATITTTISASADLSVTLDGPTDATVGGIAILGLQVMNAGPSDATSLTVTATLPAEVVAGSASGAGWSCTAQGSQVACVRDAQVAAAATMISIPVTLPATPMTLAVEVMVAAATSDPVATNNSASLSFDVAELPPPDGEGCCGAGGGTSDGVLALAVLGVCAGRRRRRQVN